MNPDRVISVIPWEMASEYVARMTACEGAESEAYYHEAYHAYWDWGRLDSSGFTERAFQAAREAEKRRRRRRRRRRGGRWRGPTGCFARPTARSASPIAISCWRRSGRAWRRKSVPSGSRKLMSGGLDSMTACVSCALKPTCLVCAPCVHVCRFFLKRVPY